MICLAKNVLTFDVSSIVSLIHVVIDFSTLSGRDICRRVLTFMHKFLEQWVDFPMESLSV